MLNINTAIKVVVSDLDGTLLNSNHQISIKTKKVFKVLHDKKYLIIIATGRHHIDAMSIIKDLEIPIYLVTSNGARIHSPKKELLYAFNINSDAVKSVFSLDIDPEITKVIFKEKYWLTNKENKKLNSFQKKLEYPPLIVNFDEIQDLSGIKFFFTHDNHEKLVDLKNQIILNHSDKFSHAFSLPICLEFMDKSIDKSFAIAKILEKEGLSFNDAISFGDGFNDEKMLHASRKGLIMKNAPHLLKSNLNQLDIIESNDDDGVANYIIEHIL